MDTIEQCDPCLGSDDKIEEAFHYIERSHGLTLLLQLLADLLRRLLRPLVGELGEGKYNECEVALKARTCFLQLHHLLGHILSVQLPRHLEGGLIDRLFDIHIVYLLSFSFLQSYEKDST